MKEILKEKRQKAKKVHLPAILNKMNYTIYFQGGYYYCWEYPNYRFKGNGHGYFDMTIPPEAKRHTKDNIDFITKHGTGSSLSYDFESAVGWLIMAGSMITSDDIDCIPNIEAVSKISDWNRPVPVLGKNANAKLRGFLTRQGMTRDQIDDLVRKKLVFVDKYGNIVFVVLDLKNKPVGHEIINWSYYWPPTSFNGNLLEGYVPPTWEYGINVNNIQPPNK